MVEVLSKEQVKEREKKTMATVAAPPKKADTAQELTKQLDDILGNLKSVIAKRNIKIADLRAEIEKLEAENTELDAKINSILSEI
tara:strand:- start:214 stop:468 length:255 start_codon:yes stop_codon:yes gene_type:complete